MDNEIRKELFQRGVDIVRYVDVSELGENLTNGYSKAIIFVMALSKKFVSSFKGTPTEHDEFAEKEDKCNELADWLTKYIQEKGYRACSQSEEANWHNERYDLKTKSSVLPHKTIARFAGLGFIGKNNLLVTEEYGCAVSMCTVLTDAPVSAEKFPIIPVNCGDCDECVKACPSKAIHGNEWTQSRGREALVDVFKCKCPLKCVIACPWTLKYADR